MPDDDFQFWPGNGVEVIDSPAGQTLSVRQRRGRTHAWQVTPAFDPDRLIWVATVKAGLVNGRAPAIRVSKEATANGLSQAAPVNPLTGLPFASAEAETYDVPIYLSPQIALPWRAIGFDGDNSGAGDGVPQYLLNLGASDTPALDEATASGNGGNLVDALTPPDGLRLVRVCELWIHQPRLALTSTVTIEGDAIVTGLQQYLQTLSVATPEPGDALRIMSGDFASAQEPALAGGLNPVNQDFSEPTFDSLLVARVYALSPANTPVGTDPDGGWATYVQHTLFYNVAYVPAASKLAPLANTGFQLFVPLAGGLAQPIFNAFTSAIDQASDNVINEITAQSLAGTFYTITGGGSTSVFPAAPPVTPQGATGSDKSGRLAAQAQAAMSAVAQVRLEVPYPWTAVPFSPALLTLGRN